MSADESIAAYINGGSDAVEGWFHRIDMLLFWILDSVQKANGITGDLCEVGVWKGKSLVLLAMLARDDESVFGVDSYPDDVLSHAKATLATHVKSSGRVQHIRTDTASLTGDRLRREFSRKFRMLHIDAGHEYHEVMHSLLLFVPFLAADGVLVMDDYHDHEFPGVAAATLDFARHPSPRQFVPFLAGANKMYLCSPAIAARFQAMVLGHPSLSQSLRLSRIRDHIVLITGSREPMPPSLMASMIADDVVDLASVDELERLALSAARNSQSALQASSRAAL